jgi:hypothetical protein
MIRVDLEAAGIAYETPSGVVDFHALRGCYISFLVSSGASVKTCQTLARHSTPSLTIGIYAKESLHDISGAVDALPDLTPEVPAPEALAATGTHGQHIDKRFALPLPYSGDGLGRNLADTGGMAPGLRAESGREIERSQVLSLSGVDANSRALADPDVECGREWAEPGSNRRHQDFQSCALLPQVSSPPKGCDKTNHDRQRRGSAQPQIPLPSLPPSSTLGRPCPRRFGPASWPWSRPPREAGNR